MTARLVSRWRYRPRGWVIRKLAAHGSARQTTEFLIRATWSRAPRVRSVVDNDAAVEVVVVDGPLYPANAKHAAATVAPHCKSAQEVGA